MIKSKAIQSINYTNISLIFNYYIKLTITNKTQNRKTRRNIEIIGRSGLYHSFEAFDHP